MSSSRRWSMSNSDKSRWKPTEQTMLLVRINLVQNTQCCNMTSMIPRQESLIRGKPGLRIHLALEKLKMTFSGRPPHRRTIFKDWENNCIVSTKQHGGVRKDMLHQPQNTNSWRDTGDNNMQMVFEGKPAIKLQAKNVNVGTSASGNPRQDRVTVERVDSPGSTNGISLVRIQYHAPVTESQLSPCYSRQQHQPLPLMWSHQHRHIVSLE